MTNEQRKFLAQCVERMRVAVHAKSCTECRGSGGFGPLAGKCPECKGVGNTDTPEITAALGQVHIHGIVDAVLLLDLLSEARQTIADMLNQPPSIGDRRRAEIFVEDMALALCWKESRRSRSAKP